MWTVAPDRVPRRVTKPCRAALSVVCTPLSRTGLVLLSFMPTTVGMKDAPRPVSARALRSALDMFLCLPPGWVPSTLTGPLPGPLSLSLSSNAWRMRCRMYRAAGGETPITRCRCMRLIALQVGDVQVDGVHPLAERQLRVFQPACPS